MGYWLDSITALLVPLVDAVRRYTLPAVRRMRTTLRCGSGADNGRTKTGRPWVYVRDGRPSGGDESPTA